MDNLELEKEKSKILIKRYNHSHDAKGRFASGSGSGGSGGSSKIDKLKPGDELKYDEVLNLPDRSQIDVEDFTFNKPNGQYTRYTLYKDYYGPGEDVWSSQKYGSFNNNLHDLVSHVEAGSGGVIPHIKLVKKGGK